MRLVPLAEVGASDAARWGELADRAIDPHPFLEARYLQTSARHRDNARELAMVFVESGAELLAVLAVTRERRLGGLPIRTASTNGAFMKRWAGRHHPLVDAARAPEAFARLLHGLRRLPLPGLLELSRFPVDGPLAEAVAAAAADTGIPVLDREHEQRVIARPEPAVAPHARDAVATPSFALPHRGAETRRRLNRDARGLAEALGAPLRLEQRGNEPSLAAARFLDLEADGWKGDAERGGEGFRLTGHDRWFTEVLEAFGADGRLSFNVLGDTQTDVHYSVNLRSATAEFGFVDTFDRRFARFRPGVLGRVAAMHEIVAAPDVAYFDPCIDPSFAESEKLYPDRREQANLLIAHGGPAARGMLAALPAVRRLRDRVVPAERRG